MTEHLTTHPAEEGTCSQAPRITVDGRLIGSAQRGFGTERAPALHKALVRTPAA